MCADFVARNLAKDSDCSEQDCTLGLETLHVLCQAVFSGVNIITCFTLKFSLLVRLCVTTERTFYHNFITNVTVHSSVDFSNVIFQHEPCVEFLVTNVTILLILFVVLSEVSFETTFITEKLATFLAGDVNSDVHHQKSLT